MAHLDLKPENIGFDSEGTVKLFDFGLARNVDTGLKANDVAGSYRYMAPEGMKGYIVGLPSDVYSFGILLWELCTLMRPFEDIHDVATLKQQVIHKHFRPELDAVPDEHLRGLISRCWDECPNTRPRFYEISSRLVEMYVERDRSREKSVECVSSTSTERSSNRFPFKIHSIFIRSHEDQSEKTSDSDLFKL